MNTPKERHFTNLDNYLTYRGLSSSRVRLEIFDLILSISQHFDANELFLISRKKNIQISRASIFRNLPIFEKVGIIRKVQFTHRHTHYEYICDSNHHEHLICLSCGNMVEFLLPKIESTLEKISNKFNFKMLSHKFEINGICKECAKKNETH